MRMAGDMERLQQQEAAAVEAEDFEAAANCSAQLDTLKQTLAQQQRSLADAEDKSAQLVSPLASLFVLAPQLVVCLPPRSAPCTGQQRLAEVHTANGSWGAGGRQGECRSAAGSHLAGGCTCADSTACHPLPTRPAGTG